MQYLIDSKVILSREGLRTPGMCEAEVRLTKIPLRLLYVLAEKPNTEISRSYIFHQVWEQHGLEASGTSLTVHLSNLRKHLYCFGINHDAIKVLPTKDVYFTAIVESIPNGKDKSITTSEFDNNPTHTIPLPVKQKNLNNNISRKKNTGIKIKKIAVCIIHIIITSLIINYSSQSNLSSENVAEWHLSYAGWKKISEINKCNYYFLKDYVVRSSNVKDKIERFITDNNIKCKPSDLVLVSVHDRNATKEQNNKPKRDFMAFCHAISEGFACESYYYYNGK